MNHSLVTSIRERTANILKCYKTFLALYTRSRVRRNTSLEILQSAMQSFSSLIFKGEALGCNDERPNEALAAEGNQERVVLGPRRFYILAKRWSYARTASNY